MKIIHKYTLFKFTVNGDEWTIICPSSKHHENIFSVYKGNIFIGNYQPAGCHVNKTMALLILKTFIK